MTFEEVKADYIKLNDDYGEPLDMDGGFVQSENVNKLILNPNKTNAKKYMIEVINYGFQWGEFWRTEVNGDFPISGDEYLQDCYDLYA